MIQEASSPPPVLPTSLTSVPNQPQQQQPPSSFLRAPANPMNFGMGANPIHLSSLLPTDSSQFSITPNLQVVGNDLNRLQQLQQFGTQTASTTVLPQQPAQLQQQQSSDLLRSFMDQKVQLSRYEDQLRRQRFMVSPAEPLLQAPILDETASRFQQFLMGQPTGQLAVNPLNLTMLNRPPLTLPSPHELSLRDDTRRMRGGVIEPFPEKLHRLLTEVELAGRPDVISFIASGKAFAIHKPDKFFKEIVPKYFRQSRLSSFKRQLNLYGFELINTGPARGGYFHEMFIKDRPELCRRMRRVAVKLHAKQNEKQESPNFYNMTPVEKGPDESQEHSSLQEDPSDTDGAKGATLDDTNDEGVTA